MIHKTLKRCIEESDNKICTPIQQVGIAEWAEKHVVLTGAYAITGKFRLGKSRYLIAILEAIKDEKVREVCVIASTQGGKSMVMDLSLIWSVVNRPGPSMFVMQSNQVAEEHFQSRVIPTLKNTDIVREYLPAFNRISVDCINFTHMPLFVHGPGERRLQSKSIMNCYCSEVWQYPRGTMDFIRKRTKQFLKYGMSKIILESQGGDEGSDLELAYKRGTQEVFHVPCPHCKELFVPDISYMNCEGKKWGDPQLNLKNSEGEYDYSLLEKLLTMQCPLCKGLIKETEKIRTQWSMEGKYIQTNPKPLSGHRSFTWNAFIHDPWFDIVYEFIEATHLSKKGAHENLLNFFRQRMARNIEVDSLYDEHRFVPIGEYDVISPFPKEDTIAVFFTIDVQEDRYIGLIRAWDKKGNSRLMWKGEMYSANEIEEIRNRYNLPPHHVALDTGHRTREIYSLCIEKGYLGIKGVKDKRGFLTTKTIKQGNVETVRKSWKFWMKSETGGDPAMGTAQQGKVSKAKVFLFCVNAIKDILSRMRDGKTETKWEVIGKPEDLVEYNKQMYSERMKEVVNRYGKTERFWMPIKDGMANHYWDIECYQVGLALMHPDIPIKESVLAQDKSVTKVVESEKPE